MMSRQPRWQAGSHEVGLSRAHGAIILVLRRSTGGLLRALLRQDIIAGMSLDRSRIHLGRAVLVAAVCLALPGCGGGTCASDIGEVGDAAQDLTTGPSDGGVLRDTADKPSDGPVRADIAVDTADAPLGLGRDGADGYPYDAVAMDMARRDAERLDLTAADGQAVAGRDAPEADATGLVGDADMRKQDSADDRFEDPACSIADSDGFFSSCSSCRDPGNCDSLTVGGRTRQACGCSNDSDCPCGFACGCYAIAASIQACGICTR